MNLNINKIWFWEWESVSIRKKPCILENNFVWAFKWEWISVSISIHTTKQGKKSSIVTIKVLVK